jgi:hypothetical protein
MCLEHSHLGERWHLETICHCQCTSASKVGKEAPFYLRGRNNAEARRLRKGAMQKTSTETAGFLVIAHGLSWPWRPTHSRVCMWSLCACRLPSSTAQVFTKCSSLQKLAFLQWNTGVSLTLLLELQISEEVKGKVQLLPFNIPIPETPKALRHNFLKRVGCILH